MTLLPAPPARLTVDWSQTRKRAFRPDIDGLRGVALLLALGYWTSLPGMAGGLAGVDMLFVISGYLVVGNVCREAVDTGSVRLGHFYAQRVKRVVPALSVVVGATAVLALLLAPTRVARSYVPDLGAALGYASNWWMLSTGEDVRAANTSSPVAHLWSLAVGAQFYVMFPLAIWVWMALATRFGMSRRIAVWVLLIAATASSFILYLWLSANDPKVALLGTHTRLWELGLGGIVALMTPDRRPGLRDTPSTASRASLEGLLASAGVCLLIAATVRLGPSNEFGVALWMPALGAAFVLMSGARAWTRSLLTWGPLQFLGRTSYPWYLWQLPVIVIAATRFPALSWQLRLALTLGAGLLAVLTNRWIERPAGRIGSSSADRPTVIALFVTASLVATAALGATTVEANQRLKDAAATAVSAKTPQQMFYDYFTVPTAMGSGPTLPSPTAAHRDVPTRPACLVRAGTDQPRCVWGAGNPNRVVVFGDGFAQQWQPAFQRLSRSGEIEFNLLAHAGCSAADISLKSGKGAPFAERACQNWRERQLKRLEENPPTAVFLASSPNYSVSPEQMADGWTSTIERLRQAGIKTFYIRATPHAAHNPPSCVARSLKHWSDCMFSPNGASEAVPMMLAQRKLDGVAVVDTNQFLCRAKTRCPAVRNGLLLYRDQAHLTATAATALTPVLRRALQTAGVL